MNNEVKMSNDSYKDKLEKLINICHKHNINILITKEEINECLVNDKNGKKVVDTKKMFEKYKRKFEEICGQNMDSGQIYISLEAIKETVQKIIDEKNKKK